MSYLPLNGGYTNNNPINLNQPPTNGGQEYDYRVPDNFLVGSPGGTADIFHHWTHGFYGDGAVSTDKFGGSSPNHLYGAYGAMYPPAGNITGQRMGYYNPTNQISATSPYVGYWQNEQSPEPPEDDFKNVTLTDNFELIEGIDGSDAEDVVKCVQKNKQSWFLNSPLGIFILLIFVFIVFGMWGEAFSLFLRNKLHSGKEITYGRMTVYAIIATVVFLFAIYFFDVPITTFE